MSVIPAHFKVFNQIVCARMVFQGRKRRAPATEINKNAFVLPVKRKTPMSGFNNVESLFKSIHVKKKKRIYGFQKDKTEQFNMLTSSLRRHPEKDKMLLTEPVISFIKKN